MKTTIVASPGWHGNKKPITALDYVDVVDGKISVKRDTNDSPKFAVCRK